MAIIKSNVFGSTFRYLKDGVKEARDQGFVCFPEFPDVQKTYSTNVMNALALRINDSERSDIQSYYDFWGIPETARKDTYRLLAYTQGILPTDNFEFLAEYYGVPGVSFVSELTGLSENQLSNDAIQEGDELDWKLEPDNEYDPYAVVLMKNNRILGHVKRIHSKVFYLPSNNLLKVRVKKIEHNGHISRALIHIYNRKG